MKKLKYILPLFFSLFPVGHAAAHQSNAKAMPGDHGKVASECVDPQAKPSPRCAETPTPLFDAEGRLWLIWTQNGHMYVAGSEDGGSAFAAPARVTPKPLSIEKNGENRPKAAVAPDGSIYVTFTVTGEQKYSGIVYFSRSSDGGKSFSEPAAVTDEDKPVSQSFETLNIGADGRIHIVWIDKRDREAAKREEKKYAGSAIYYAYSDDGGKSFSTNKKLADHSCECCRIATAIDGAGSPVIVWRHIFGKNIRDHAVMKLTADGSPGRLARVSEDNWALDGCPHHGPAIAVGADDVFHVVWFTDGEARKGLFHARSEDGGNTFSEPFGFGDRADKAAHPDVLAAAGRVFTAWKEFNGEISEVLIMESEDNGRTWSKPQRIATSADASDHPLLIHDGRFVYVSWATRAEGWRLFKAATIGKAAP